MEKILGLDLGTNSIGWAIVERDSTVTLVDKGVHIFQEGVKIEKGNESSKASERTTFRASRKHYFRRRLRKIETLEALVKLGFCPPLSHEQLKDWKEKGVYPISDEFILWQRTDDSKDKNPYHCRFLAVQSKVTDKYIIGRALYHIAQRRGFLSNRLESTKENEEGKVKDSIKALDTEIVDAGCKTLGEYFYKCYGNDKIRTRYTARIAHYEAEFNEICRVQGINDSDKKMLYDAIFYQRPLKSQKGLVGKCTFEPQKARCPISHPRYEYYRTLCFVNNIRIKSFAEDAFRPLNNNEKECILPLFLRQGDNFDFEDIARKLVGKNNYGSKDKPEGKPYIFNYSMKTTVSGMPFTAKLKSLFGDNIAHGIRSCYVLADNKSDQELINDIWHVLFSFDKDEKLIEFASQKLGMDDQVAKKFAKIHPQQGYAQLSLKAINKITSYLERGYIYSHAVFLANIERVVDKEDWATHKHIIEDGIGKVIDGYEDYRKDVFADNQYLPKAEHKTPKTIQGCIFEFLLDSGCGLIGDYKRKLYHPSMIDTFPKQTVKLGSPRTNSVRNPMAMRALFQLRRLINTLLADGKITPATKINIELARELNNANKRKAIEQWQRSIETENKKYADEIRKECPNFEPNDDDILRYRLWIEQNKQCLYTGEQIAISDFVGANKRYDFEHTVPQSRGGDDSQMNKTLCNADFNRNIKSGKIPFELSNFDDVKVRIEHWQREIEDLESKIEKNKRRSTFTSKEEKDRHITARNFLQYQLDYKRGKYGRIVAKEVESGFKNSQIVDAGIISKYAKQYLQSLFSKTYVIKGGVTADFRKLWGVEPQYSKKDRSNHIHHCIDAVVIACIGKYQNDLLSYYKSMEEYHFGRANRVVFRKPWETFTEDVKKIANDVLVSHYTADNIGKQTKKRKRVRGKVVEGEYMQGDTARGSLHQETYYGAILRNDEVKYVVRKSLAMFKEEDVAKIVDDVVREKVQCAVAQHGLKAIQDLENCPVWMNEEKKVQIKKVRCLTPHVTAPLHIRTHRDESVHEHKRQFHVVNDSNYAMAIYEGVDKKGVIKRTFEIINNIDASSMLKQSAKTEFDTLLPITKKGLVQKAVIKTGTMVIFWEETPDEIWELEKSELQKRLYKVIKMGKDGRITFKHNQESRSDDLLKSDYEKEFGQKAPHSLTDGISSFDFQKIAPKLRLNPNNFNMLVQGIDFELTITGEIKPLRRC